PFIEACSPGPYLEMFARHAQPGWILWGDEAHETVEPRGKVHRGYGGGPIQVPNLKPHVRVNENAATVVGAELRRRYEGGLSIRDLSLETGYSIQRVRSLLKAAGATLRGRGGAHHVPA
ncbi:MAG: helix-turn-helix domain-containing protein, partial [Rhodoglobus sp.]